MFKTISITVLIFGCLSLVAMQGNENSSGLSQKSQNSIYNGVLDCETKMSKGIFLRCYFDLFKDKKIVKDTDIFISGGMPLHQHGLPTAPKLAWSEEKQTYIVEGLKFSMPGEWVLNFKINAADANEKDVVSMKFNVE